MTNYFKVLLAIFYIFLLGCNKDVTIIGNKKISSWFPPITAVLNKTIQYANGTSQGIIKIQVFNQQNEPIEGLFMNATPAINTTNFVSCSQSDAQGVIYCKFTSTVAGNIDIDFSDGVGSFTTDINFIDLPTKLSYTRVSNSAVIKQVNLGYTSFTGQRKTGWLKDSSGGANTNTEAPIFKLDLASP